MSTTADDLFGPTDPTPPDMLDRACGYARAGLSVFPAVFPDKEPPRGYLWKERASRRVADVVQDFADALADYGPDRVGIGWALGLDGFLALDFDRDRPAELDELLATPHAVNVTRRGEHLVYRQPAELDAGNSTAGFPVQGWGEMRGAGGYIVIAGPDRPGFDAGQLAHAAPFPRPDWLRPPGPAVNPAATAEVRAFLAEHTRNAAPWALDAVLARLADWQAWRGSRHESLVAGLPWAMRDAAAGFYPAAEAEESLRRWWQEVTRGEGRETEYARALGFAVAAAQADNAGVPIEPRRPPRRPDGHHGPDMADAEELEPDPDEGTPGRLPASFWDARPAHRHIRTAADARMVSAEGLLLAVLAEVAAHVPQAVWLPPWPRHGTVDLLAVIVGPPGAAKGSVLDIAAEVLPPPANAVHVSLGSAEGFVLSFFDPNPDKDDAKSRPMLQHARPVIFRTDEIGTLAGLTGRERGEMLAGQLKQAWSGEPIGFGYAHREKRLMTRRLSTRAVAVMGAAPAKAAALFTDLGGGLPERLIFAPATCSDLPPLEELPEFPGRLDWTLPRPPDLGPSGARVFPVADEVADEIRRTQYLIRSGELLLDALEVHALLQQLKLAALLAVLDRRYPVTAEDWQLAGLVMTVHRRTRAELRATLRAVDEAAEARRIRQHVGREVAADQAKETRRIVDAARNIAGRVHERGPVGRSDLRRDLRSQRDVFDAALAHAVAEGWITERSEPGQGEPKRTLHPGRRAPSGGHP